MDSPCTPSAMLNYSGYHLHDGTSMSFDDASDSDSSSYSGSSSSSFSTASLGLQHPQDPNAHHHLNGIPNHHLQQQPQQPQQGNGLPPQPQVSSNGQAISYHYFCNFPTCDYHSARSDPVKRHRDTHYPDYKPYTCNYCQSSSARRDSTREHCLKQHKDDSENAFRYDTTIPKPEGWIAYEPKRAPWPPIMV
ncbi:hypothetical protein BGX23_012580 [Mortierella sp. AD031]|nr:hypothetical protein BGX23_012580 [Mortierella sp. AD031]KAG0200834.1 hypothetical protein BGX33_010750 [Mortierella sp. NVP41]